MPVKIHYRIMLLFIAFTITGCTAFAMRDANEQLTTYYYAKLKAQQAVEAQQDNSYFLIESALASLQTLAENAAAQAEKESDVLNKISFYRIATTAAWQAGDNDVVLYARAGQTLCDAGNLSKAPRDCGMLKIIPALASVDEQTRAFNALQDKVTAPIWESNDEDIKTAESIYNHYWDALNKLMQQRPALRETGAHLTFLNGVDKNIGTLLCTHIDLDSRGILSLVGSSQLQTMDTEIKKMKCSLVNAGVDDAFAPCISSISTQECN